MKIKLLKENATVPTLGSGEAAGYELYACLKKEISILPHETIKVGTGIAVEIPKGYFGGLFARSGLALKKGLRPGNCVGVIDSDYRGEIIAAIHNDSDEPQIIQPNERIAQLIILPYERVELEVVDDLDDTKRGDGGFGSTGS